MSGPALPSTRPAGARAGLRRHGHAAAVAAAFVGFALLAPLAGCQRVGGPRVNLQRMMEQPRYQTYGASRYFADGMAMRLPPPGTVAREDPLPQATPALAPPDSATLALGREQYHIACAPCHGETGRGDGMVAANLPGVAGLALQAPAARALPAGALYALLGDSADIRHVRARELAPAERRALVAYVRALVGGGAP